MSVSVVLLVLLGGALLIPLFGGDDDETDNENEIDNEILGGPGNDVIDGTEENDLIRTFLGDDTIYGNGGNDRIFSGGGDDIVYGGLGNDFVRGGSGNDRIFGEEGDDRLFGDQGDDYIDGGSGDDIIRGGRGDDLIFGRGGADVMSGEDNNDTIFGWQNGTVMNGGLTDADNPDQSNDDTLVMVTGEGVMTNGTGDNMNIALANVSDGQETSIIVTDFDRADDTLVLTVDYATDGTPMMQGDADFTINYAFQDATPDRGAGMLVTVTWDNADGDVTDQESASAFLEGFRIGFGGIPGNTPPSGEIVDNSLINVEVYLTNEASLDDPVATLQGIGISTPAMETWFPTT
ncbi:calcium-binding protein [Yoonia sp.]|uniref:calcium-binding protein n=1 Tax=Yoonia sp. TaxID=2212373 RepID=UPI002FDA07A0